MPNTINFENFDKEFFDEELEDMDSLVQETIEYARENGSNLYDLFKYEIRWITLKIVKGETDRDELSEYFKLAMQGIYGHVKTLDNRGEPTRLTIANDEVELSHSGTSYADVFTVMEGLTQAAVCRNKTYKAFALSLSNDSPLLGKGKHSYHPIYKLYILLKDEGAVDEEKFESYEKASVKYYKEQFPEGVKDEYENYVPLIENPRKALWREYFLGSEESFNEKLRDALEKNKAYYDTEDHNRQRDVSGWLPWNLISTASKAYDKGWQITVEDPRLPMFLVKGECTVDSLE